MSPTLTVSKFEKKTKVSLATFRRLKFTTTNTPWFGRFALSKYLLCFDWFGAARVPPSAIEKF